MTRTCTIPGCDAKHWCHGYCKPHYSRWYTTGTTDPPPPGRRHRHDHRRLATKEKADIIRLYASGLSQRQLAARFNVSQARICELLKHHGVTARRRGQRSGTRHPLWKGHDLARQKALHRRIHRIRGPASMCRCTDCGEPASEWSYNHSGIRERIDVGENYVFSTDVMQYAPRCQICHLVFDGFNPLPLHEIVEVRELWGTGEWTLAELAAEFGVRKDWITRLINGECWAMLTLSSPQVRYSRRAAAA